MKVKMAISLATVLVCACFLELSKAGIVHQVLRSPQATVHSWIAQQAGGAVAVAMVSPNEIEYFFGGKLSPNNDGLPTDQTIFELGSVTKGFTGLLLADQVLLGKVFLNDTLSKVLTDWPGRFTSKVGDVTLLELSTHTSGLGLNPDNMDHDLYVAYTKKQLYEWLDKVKPFQRGSFQYSNGGVAVLGLALAARAGKPYEDLLKERVLRRLGLQDATITLTDEQKRRQAPGHGFTGDVVKNYPFDALAPGGALRSSVSELAKFLQFTTGLGEHGRHMDEVLDLATRYWGDSTFGENHIGLGWFRLMLPEDRLMIWHAGATLGYNSCVCWIPERQIGVVALASILSISPNNTVDVLR